MKKIILHILISIPFFFSIHCGVTQPVHVIPKDETRLQASFGGPIIPLGTIAIPVPYLNMGVQYGFQENVTLFGNFHTTALLFKDIGVDGGCAVRLNHEEGMYPEITAKGQLFFFWDVMRSNNIRVFPMGSIIGSYSTGDRSLIYFGADNLFQIHKADYFFAPLIGYQFGLNRNMTMQFETKWLAANKDTRHGVFEGATSIGGRGNFSFYLGMEMTLK